MHNVLFSIQVTNYGLGGICEEHNDPYGYNEGAYLTDHVHSGDIMASLVGGSIDTIMSMMRLGNTIGGRLSDITAGEATTFFNGVDFVSP